LFLFRKTYMLSLISKCLTLVVKFLIILQFFSFNLMNLRKIAKKFRLLIFFVAIICCIFLLCKYVSNICRTKILKWNLLISNFFSCIELIASTSINWFAKEIVNCKNVNNWNASKTNISNEKEEFETKNKKIINW